MKDIKIHMEDTMEAKLKWMIMKNMEAEDQLLHHHIRMLSHNRWTCLWSVITAIKNQKYLPNFKIYGTTKTNRNKINNNKSQVNLVHLILMITTIRIHIATMIKHLQTIIINSNMI